MRIKFSGLRPITVDRQTFSAWFPQLSGMHGIDGDELVEDLDTRLQHRYGIPSRMIEYTLSELFKKLGHYSCFDSGQKQKRLIQELWTQLVKDVKNVYHSSKGLRSSRQMFITLSYLAADHASILLAEALAQFWVHFESLISQESPTYRGDWARALAKVQEALEGPTTRNLEPFAIMPYAGYHRGRARRALPWPGHRARSLPVIRRRHSPDMSLAIPTYPSSGWASPMMSPVGYPGGDYFDELQNLQWQQNDMGMKLDNVDGKLDVLLGGLGYGYGYGY